MVCKQKHDGKCKALVTHVGIIMCDYYHNNWSQLRKMKRFILFKVPILLQLIFNGGKEIYISSTKGRYLNSWSLSMSKRIIKQTSMSGKLHIHVCNKANLFQWIMMKSQLWTTNLGYLCMHTLFKIGKRWQFFWILKVFSMESYSIIAP
jgi:1-acyl-sn-glycerol-3-phosphate acyltransferase